MTSSNDRYANQETNFLLQRIESFAGICILTTNHDPAIDEAFRRRLSVHVRFPMPDEEERGKLWHAMLPASTPVDADLEVSSLAKKFVMAGGNIRNAVLRAAFLAADADEAIGNYQLRQAAQLEYEGMGKRHASSAWRAFHEVAVVTGVAVEPQPVTEGPARARPATSRRAGRGQVAGRARAWRPRRAR